MRSVSDSFQISEQECAKEPIHIPGTIQSFGACLALDSSRQRITWASENVEDLLGIAAQDLLGKNLEAVVRATAGKSLGDHLNQLHNGQRARTQLALLGEKIVDALDADIHIRDGIVVIELENQVLPSNGFSLGSPQVYDAIDEFYSVKDLTSLSTSAARIFRELTGYDRVMIYRFDDNWNGNVIAESLSAPTVDSYLGQWFPASDIPPQARQLFYDNWIRIIPDVNFSPIKLVPSASQTAAALDLSLSILRSPSPIHLEYLRNMNVAASLTVSLRKDGKLWGLIACHHETPKLLNPVSRFTCEFLGRLVSSLIASKEVFEDFDYRLSLREIHRALVQRMSEEDDFVRGLVKSSPNLLDLTASSGAAAALYFEGRWTIIGKVPKIQYINDLIKWLKRQEMPGGFFQTNVLPRLWPEAAKFRDVAAGIIAVSIPKSEDNYILWFRPEVIQTVKWAGNPDKNLSQDPGTMQLHPRKSFSVWKEIVRDAAIPWRDAELEAARELRRSVIELDLERQFTKERMARSEADTERRRAEFLAEVGKVLSSSLNLETVLESTGELCVRHFCEWCVLSLYNENRFVRVLVRHSTPEGQRIITQITSFAGLTPNNKILDGFSDTFSTIMVPSVEDAWLRDYCQEEDYYDYLKNLLRLRSYLSVPLVSRGKLLGIIEFANSENHRHFGAKDAQMAEELARRVAVAIDNAQLYLEVNSLYQEAQKANRYKDEVLAIVSHDLKNPIRSISFNVQIMKMLRQKPGDDSVLKTDKSLNLIETSIKVMKSLIQDLLDAAKLEAKALLEIEKVQTDSQKLLSEIMSVLVSVAEEKNQTIDFLKVSDCKVWCDTKRIQQVISNLVGNAIKFSPAGSLIKIAASCENKIFKFSVADQGAGIESSQLERIFERFWQGKRQASEGLGLGLAIAKGIIAAHGGKIWAESKVGVGTKFTFEIPNP